MISIAQIYAYLKAVAERLSISIIISLLALVISILAYYLNVKTFRLTNRPFVGIVEINNAFVHNPPLNSNVSFPEGKALVHRDSIQYMDTFFRYKNVGIVLAEEVWVDIQVVTTRPDVETKKMPEMAITLLPDQIRSIMLRFTREQILSAFDDPGNVRVHVKIRYKDSLGESYKPYESYLQLYLVPITGSYFEATWQQVPAF